MSRVFRPLLLLLARCTRHETTLDILEGIGVWFSDSPEAADLLARTN